MPDKARRLFFTVYGRPGMSMKMTRCHLLSVRFDVYRESLDLFRTLMTQFVEMSGRCNRYRSCAFP